MTPSGAGITIVGLGPGDPGLRTVAGQRAIESAERIILRTSVHPGVEDLTHDPRVTTCDDLYVAADRFESLYAAIAERVVAAAMSGAAVVYAVPGHPRFAERTVPLIEARARSQGIPVATLDAVSFVGAAASSAGVDPVSAELQLADAERLAQVVDDEPFAAGRLNVDPARPLLVAQLYNQDLAATVKIALSRIYPDEHRVVVLQATGVPNSESVREVALHELDRQPVDHLTSLFVPPQPPLAAFRAPDTLTRIVARLRAPDGCPWDREQTHASLRESIVEEAYEAVDAIDQNDAAALCEELGDLLLLVAMHAQLAEEEGTFRIEDVYEAVSSKLIRRHPHVFGDVDAATPDAVIRTWEEVKARERQAAGAPLPESNPVDRLPKAMPAMRKSIEALAPRSTLRAPENDATGGELLAAIERLLAQGVDPERALEASLRSRMASGGQNLNESPTMVGATRAGEGSA